MDLVAELADVDDILGEIKTWAKYVLNITAEMNTKLRVKAYRRPRELWERSHLSVLNQKDLHLRLLRSDLSPPALQRRDWRISPNIWGLLKC